MMNQPYQPPESKFNPKTVGLLFGCLTVVVCFLVVAGGYWWFWSTRRAQAVPSPTVAQAVTLVAASPTLPPPTSTPLFTATPYPTITPFFTPTPISPYSAQVEKRSDGRYIVVTERESGETLSYGPLAAGALAEGPNGKFCAYVDILGNVYVATYGDPVLHRLDVNLKRDYQLQALMHGSEPEYDLSFETTSHGTYTLVIHEIAFGDTIGVELPLAFTSSP